MYEPPSSPIDPLESVMARMRTSISGFSYDDLIPIRSFYAMADPQSQIGIVSVLAAIRNRTDYQILLYAQCPLVTCPFSRSYDRRVVPVVTFFYFAAMYRADPVRLMQLLTDFAECILALGSTNDVVLPLIERLFALGEGGKLILALDIRDPIERMCRVLSARVASYHDYILRVLPQIRDAFLPEEFRVFPTDGDLHVGGCAPLKIVVGRDAWYYKPRSLRAERLLNEAIQMLNSVSEGAIPQLPLLTIQPFQIGASSSIDLIAEAVHVDSMGLDAALDYAKALGALCCLAKVYGFADIHSGNLIATAAGPLIIDAECAALRYVINGRTLNVTECVLLFGRDVVGSRCDFDVEGQSFVTRFRLEQRFRDFFNSGYLAAHTLFMTYLDQFLPIYDSALTDSTFSSRIVAIITETFIQGIYAYGCDKPYGAFSIRGEMDLIWKFLQEHEFPLPQGQDDLDYDLLYSQILSDYAHGLVPAFRVRTGIDGRPGYFLIDGHPFLRLTSIPLDTLHQEFMENLEHIPDYLSAIPHE